ncbi:MAG: Na+/H+ antiporter NhaC family protein [Prevotella sp.]|nr:Na+/H+ antiporter NhaC family protein [Prevotella sp.]
MNNKKGIFALSPLIVFVTLYVVSSIIANDFYKMPISVAFMLASIYAVATSKGSMTERINTFSHGAGTPGIMLMLWVFVLAGAFAAAAKSIGCIDSTVGLMLSVVPGGMLLPGLFLTTCFVSMAIGTSVGCIVALVPIAAGLATATGDNLPLYVGVVVGGAFFGDNLSFISDTTIAATTSQGCKMNDKFKANAFIAVPAAAIVLVAYALLGQTAPPSTNLPEVSYIKILPYLTVIVAALYGLNVMTVLTLGIVLTGIIGICSGTIGIYDWFENMGSGITGMGELIIITMLAGGLFEIVKKNGGIDYIIGKATAHIHGKRGGEMTIGALVAMVDVCTANNTVAIITVSGIAQQISRKFGIDNRRTASLLDTFSCFMQGIIPYGAQMLMAAGLAHISPMEIMPYLYYPFTLGAIAVASIIFRLPRSYAR